MGDVIARVAITSADEVTDPLYAYADNWTDLCEIAAMACDAREDEERSEFYTSKVIKMSEVMNEINKARRARKDTSIPTEAHTKADTCKECANSIFKRCAACGLKRMASSASSSTKHSQTQQTCTVCKGSGNNLFGKCSWCRGLGCQTYATAYHMQE